MRYLIGLFVAVAAVAIAARALAQTPGAQPRDDLAQTPGICPVSPDHIVLNAGLERSRQAVLQGRLTILAIGSSSIEGIGASRPDLGFTPLLKAGLERRLPGVEITIVNRGIGGESAFETTARLAHEIEVSAPDLVIWQLGTNDVLRGRSLDDVLADFRRGQHVLNAAKVDVLLIDTQRLPEDERNTFFRGRNPALRDMARLIGLEGGRVGYAVLRRFDAMQGWSGLERGGVGPDGLHLNDAGYACWAENTAEGLAAALR